jgi:rSAM/selenodomain-associated transferase 2
MLSVIIPTLNAGQTLPATIGALVPGAVSGLVREVVVIDGGSSDATPGIAEAMGARFVRAPRGRGRQLVVGAETASSDWLLFLHADTRLAAGWEEEVAQFIERIGEERAAAFRFILDDRAPAARRLERMVALRCRLFGLAYGDQGLLISRRLYRRIGGYAPLPVMEDVDLSRRIGRRRLVLLRTPAVTSARRFRDGGYLWRSARNLGCLTLFFCRVPARVIVRLYG